MCKGRFTPILGKLARGIGNPLFSVTYEVKGVKFCTQVPRKCMHKPLVLDFHLLLNRAAGAAGSADLKVNKSVQLSLNLRIFLNTELIYTK